MATSVIHNRPNLSVVVHATSNTGNVVIAGNTSQSNVATGSEVITGAAITQLWYGGDSSVTWVIQRGGNTVWIASCSADSYVDFRGNGNSLDLYPAANLVCTAYGTGAANAFIMVELKKIGTPSSYV